MAEPSSERSDRPPPTPGFSRFGLFIGTAAASLIGCGVVFSIARFVR